MIFWHRTDRNAWFGHRDNFSSSHFRPNGIPTLCATRRV